jgi:hypothetical protein
VSRERKWKGIWNELAHRCLGASGVCHGNVFHRHGVCRRCDAQYGLQHLACRPADCKGIVPHRVERQALHHFRHDEFCGACRYLRPDLGRDLGIRRYRPRQVERLGISGRYQTGKKRRAIDVQFRDGDVVSASMQPPRKIPKNWVPVTQADMRNVVDPLSGLIFPADTRVCPKSVPIFDGESRMDLKLSAEGYPALQDRGFSGRCHRLRHQVRAEVRLSQGPR